MKKVRKAIIPAAGLGTRFLPATKTIPKEMLPVVDKPTIQYIVEEAVKSGIEDIIIVTGRNKSSIEDHFDINQELEWYLQERNKPDLLSLVREISDLTEIHYVRQKKPLGLGHAIWCARKFIGNEPFAVLLGDMIFDSDPPCLKQLMDVYQEMKSSVIAIDTVDWDEVGKYGIIDGVEMNDRLFKIRSLIEKPTTRPPTNSAIMGRYILEPEIFDLLEKASPGVGGEIQLTDALQELLQNHSMYAYIFSGKLYDVGDKLGYLMATVELACKNESLREKFRSFLNETNAGRGESD